MNMEDSEKLRRIKQAMEDYHRGYNIDGHERDDLDTLIAIDNILSEE